MKKKSLTFFREQKGLTAEKLAKKVGVSTRSIRYWESDKELLRNAKVSSVLKLCKALGISIDEIL